MMRRNRDMAIVFRRRRHAQVKRIHSASHGVGYGAVDHKRGPLQKEGGISCGGQILKRSHSTFTNHSSRRRDHRWRGRGEVVRHLRVAQQSCPRIALIITRRFHSKAERHSNICTVLEVLEIYFTTVHPGWKASAAATCRVILWGNGEMELMDASRQGDNSSGQRYRGRGPWGIFFYTEARQILSFSSDVKD